MQTNQMPEKRIQEFRTTTVLLISERIEIDFPSILGLLGSVGNKERENNDKEENSEDKNQIS